MFIIVVTIADFTLQYKILLFYVIYRNIHIPKYTIFFYIPTNTQKNTYQYGKERIDRERSKTYVRECNETRSLCLRL